MELVGDSTHDSVERIALSGRMDIEGTQSIELKLAAHTSGDGGVFITDLSRVSFVASMGIRALIVSAKSVRTRRGRLAICGPDANVENTLRTAGIDQLIPIFEDFPSALDVVYPAS